MTSSDTGYGRHVKKFPGPLDVVLPSQVATGSLAPASKTHRIRYLPLISAPVCPHIRERPGGIRTYSSIHNSGGGIAFRLRAAHPQDGSSASSAAPPRGTCRNTPRGVRLHFSVERKAVGPE